MQKLYLFTIILVFKSSVLNAQYGRNWIDKGIEDPFTKEYFVKPLIDELKKTFPYSEPEIIKEIEDILSNKRLLSFFSSRAEYKKIKDKYFKVGNYIYYPDNSIASDMKNGVFKDFKSFKKSENYELKRYGIKKKPEQEKVYMTIKKNLTNLANQVNIYLSEKDYNSDLLDKFIRKYNAYYNKDQSYRAKISEELEKLLIEKISPNLNAIDNILILPKYKVKNNTLDDNEALKKLLLDKGLVELNTLFTTYTDGYKSIYPKYSQKLDRRWRDLRSYFDYEEERESDFKTRIFKLWYGNLDNEFALENFLKVCGDNVPNKEAFLSEEDTEDELKDVIDIYVRITPATKKDKNLLFNNIIINHYGIKIEDLKDIRNELSAKKEKEEIEKGGFLRDKIFYKINSEGKFDYIHFKSYLGINRTLNQSQYWGDYEKKNGNIYRVTFMDGKTGVKLPEFEARLSSDKTKLYIGNDKVPYILRDSKGKNCLKQKNTKWYSSDGSESFSTRSWAKWESKITGGISAKGLLYKISNTKYAFIISNNSWGGKIDNNLVIIRTDNNCNTIYYGSGRKKMTTR